MHDWIPTHGREPRFKQQPYFVLFRNGEVSKQAYIAKQLQWGHNRPGMDDDYDVVAVRRA